MRAGGNGGKVFSYPTRLKPSASRKCGAFSRLYDGVLRIILLRPNLPTPRDQREKTNMLSREELAVIRAEIERLEKARDACNDSGIRKQIDFWIGEQRQMLLFESKKRGPSSDLKRDL